jgi:hypothetical protein
MTRTTWTTAVILAGTLAVPAHVFSAKPTLVRGGGAVQRGATQAPKLVSRTVSPGAGREEVMFTVPMRSQLLVTQACIEHTAMQIAVGDDDNRITFGPRGCTDYAPGFVVAGGERILCDNGSGMERSCALVGVLEDLPRVEGQRVKFHQLR